jgi:hypothetical protein
MENAMAAGRIVLPEFMPALDLNGNPVAGAKLYIYENETTTKASVYSNEALSVALANPVIADASGQFPPIWASTGDDGSTVYTLSITDGDGAAIGNRSTFDSYPPSVDYETAALTLAEAAKTGAETALASAEAIWEEIQAIQATGDDAAAIALRAAKAANLSDLADIPTARDNLGLVDFTPVDDATELAAAVVDATPVILRQDITVTGTQTLTNSVHIEGATDDVETYRATSGKFYEIEPAAVLGGVVATAAAAGTSTLTFVDAIPAGLVAGVFVDIGDLAHFRVVTAVNTGTKTITLNYALGRSVAKGETVNYRVPIERVTLTRQKLRKLAGSGSANVTIKYAKTVDLSRLTSEDCSGNAITLYGCGWSILEGRIIGPDIKTKASQFGLFMLNCENAHITNLHGEDFGEYLIQFKDCRDCTGRTIRAYGTDGGDVGANIKCSGLNPVYNVHLEDVKGTDCLQAAVSLTHLRKEGTWFHPFNVSATNIRGYNTQAVQLIADYGSQWATPMVNNIAAYGDAVLYIAENVPPGIFTNVVGVRSPSRSVDVESSGHLFIGGLSQDAYYGGSSGSDIRLTAATAQAVGRIEFSDLPGNNTTITLNGKVITFKTSGAVAANHECNIGATVAATLVNLAGVAGAGTGGLLNDSTDPLLTVATYAAWTAALQIEYDATGSAGDAYTLAVGAGSNATIFSPDGAATTTLKGGTQTGASYCTFHGWRGVVTSSSAGVLRFAQEVSASCDYNRFINCRLHDTVGEYVADYTFLGSNSQASAPSWDLLQGSPTLARRAPVTLAANGSLTVAGATTLSSSLTVTGAATFNGATTLGDAVSDAILVQGTLTAQLTSGAATVGPRAFIYRNSTSPAANDLMGELVFSGKDSGAADEEYASIMAEIVSPTAGAEGGALEFYAKGAGAMAKRARIDANGLTIRPAASITPAANGDVTFELTNNTTLTIKAKGSDGTVRSGTVTLS